MSNTYRGTQRGPPDPPKTRWAYCPACTRSFSTRSRYKPDTCRFCSNALLHDCGEDQAGEIRAAQLVRAARDKEPNWVGMGLAIPPPPTSGNT